MSARAPYGPPLEKVADCVCDVFLMGTALSIHKAAKDCSQHSEAIVDPRTLYRYVTRDLSELNRATNIKCGKKVAGDCAKMGFKVTATLNGALRDSKKVIVSGSSVKEARNDEIEDVCVTELGNELEKTNPSFRPFSFKHLESFQRLSVV